jgi:hypothetical protein
VKILELDPKQNEDASITLNTESGITNILTGTYVLQQREMFMEDVFL